MSWSKSREQLTINKEQLTINCNDFIHKLKIAIKELNETEVWLRIVVAAEMKTDIVLASLLDEGQQLQRIFGAGIQTARKNR